MRTRSGLLFVALNLLLAAPAAAQTAPRSQSIDWERLLDETVQVLSEYLKIDTTTPPGNELEAAHYLKGILEKEGIEAEILDSTGIGAGRANLYARLKGNGSKKAIALVNHMDVVPADLRYWTVDPFAGTVKDGFVWGRGAQDMKGQGVVQLMTLIAIKRSGLPLDRDLVYIANADEETNGAGALAIARNHPELLKDVEYLLTEGGTATIKQGRTSYFVGVAEKRAFWQHLTVHGTPSHGSQPTARNPVPRLVAALNRIAQFETPLHVTPATQRYFQALANDYQGEEREWLADVSRALEDPRGRAWILSDPARNALLRTTIALTELQGSNKTNVIPAEASAEIDVRLLPDQDAKAFLAELQRVAADTAVHFSQVLPYIKEPLDVPFDTDLFRAVERAAHERDPGAIVAPSISTGGTDRPAYRPLGIITYGFPSFKYDEAEVERRGAHGNDERISIANLDFGLRFLYDVFRYAQ
jgi:acetylornithine deacetylase/succinyl-diaminopimelate desuccinylase-like protein